MEVGIGIDVGDEGGVVGVEGGWVGVVVYGEGFEVCWVGWGLLVVR